MSSRKLNYCGAKTRAGTACKKTAGWGTDHVGTGRCKLHGGKSTGPKPENMRGNKNAEKHGLFSKYLPEETQALLDAIESLSPLDILWENIKIQYAAIIRAQTIMEVKNREDLVRLEKKKSEGEFGDAVEYEYHTAWDRYERFLTSQARAMTNLTNMIVKYEAQCNQGLATEEQMLRIDKLKTEIDKLKGISEEIEDLDEIKELVYEEKDDSI